jgi:peroxiredoxin
MVGSGSHRDWLIGRRLPDVTVTRLSGSSVSLANVTSSRSAILAIVRADDCLGCANFPLEFRILRNTFPHLSRILVLVGRDTGAALTRIRPHGDDFQLLLDPEEEVLPGFGMTTTPLALVTDSTGRVLFMDGRGRSAAAHFGLSQVLEELALVLSTGSP